MIPRAALISNPTGSSRSCWSSFVKATYHFEGDGTLIFFAYSTLQEVVSACASAESTLPNVSAIARKEAGENTSLNAAELLQRGKDCTRPAIHWLLEENQCRILLCRNSFQAHKVL